MESSIIALISRETGLPEESITSIVGLLESGCTVPFIAHYRKEATGGLDESKLRAVEERMIYYREVKQRQAAVRDSIAATGKLTEDLREKIENCYVKVELEDLFLPFRSKRRTHAVEARERGLEPLAEYLWNQETDAWSLEEHADVHIDPEKEVTSREESLRGAAEIVAEWISENFEFRSAIRKMMWEEGFLVSKVVPGKSEQRTKYNMYYDRREPVASIPSHRVLAIRRGTKEGILTSSIEIDDNKAADYLLGAVIQDKDSVFAPFLEAAVRYSYERLIRPSIESEVRALLKERADREAIRVFQENLKNLLLTPAAGPMVVMGLDSGGKSNCKAAVVDQNGTFLEEAVVSPPAGDVEATRTTLKEMILRHKVRAVAVGTNAGSRELERLIRSLLQEEKWDDILLVGVNDAGASVYASSRPGREEFPDLDNAARAAVTTARRVQDPLSELVKIDPKTVGVGQYQHDVDQKELHRKLIRTVESCVNQVGVDVNTAPVSLLRYVAGIRERMARNIVQHRDANGPFPTRESLRAVPGMDDRIFTQSAGFLRVRGGENPLDRTGIHPEAYPVVERMAASSGVSPGELIENKDLLSAIRLEDFATESIGLPTLNDIREELTKPGRDPRKTFTVAKKRADVNDISDLKLGMTLEGTVTNVTNFGAFVDVGVRQDGLVHLSQMSNRFIKDPRQAVKVGDVVQVKVISVEAETKRIGLSMKALQAPRFRRRRRPRRRTPEGHSDAPAGDRPGKEAAVGETVANAPGRTPRVSNDGRPPRPRRGVRRRPGRRGPTPEQTRPAEQVEEKPSLPEATLQEKIAILQSKFRGIS